jgi:nucleoside triphosphatase
MSGDDFMSGGHKNFGEETRVIVVGLIKNDQDDILICKMPHNRGVFPNQWGLPGGGVEEGERIGEALRREIREEVGLELSDVRPLFFKDGLYEKLFPDGEKRPIYMIYLIYACRALSHDVVLNPEFIEYAWATPEVLNEYDLNVETLDTFRQIGFL